MRSRILAAVSAAVLLYGSGTQAARPNEAFNWYCRHVTDGSQPACDAAMQFIESCGGYYIDHRNSDPEAAEKVIYLTFDAGYENGNVEKILDVLQKEGVPGAFFVLSHFAESRPDLIRRMTAEGHTIGNHTASHKDMTKVHDKEAFLAELEKLNEAVRQAGGTVSPYYRPPEGRFSEENLRYAQAGGYKTIFWSFGYVDWDNERQMSGSDAMRIVLGGLHNGEVLLLHPTSETNAAILGDLIRALKERGYRFGTLDELTAESAG